jgi:ankyrin repeat protein
LHEAAGWNSDIEIVKYLVSKTDDVNITSEAGDTPLHSAASSNPNADIVKYLISNDMQKVIPPS